MGITERRGGGGGGGGGEEETSLEGPVLKWVIGQTLHRNRERKQVTYYT